MFNVSWVSADIYKRKSFLFYSIDIKLPCTWLLNCHEFTEKLTSSTTSKVERPSVNLAVKSLRHFSNTNFITRDFFMYMQQDIPQTKQIDSQHLFHIIILFLFLNFTFKILLCCLKWMLLFLVFNSLRIKNNDTVIAKKFDDLN